MRKVKIHWVSKENFYKERANRFYFTRTYCGVIGYGHTWDWRKVTCLKCLPKRPKEKKL